MASESPSDQRKPEMKLPMVGLLLGLLVGAVVVWVTLNDVLESESVPQITFLRQMAYLIPMLVGGGIGGIIELWKQARTGEIARFLRRLLGGALRLIFLFVSLFLGAWLGERLYGSVGHDVGLVVSAVLVLPVWFWLICRSSSEQLSAPPPA
jgi:hypothetical protein